MTLKFIQRGGDGLVFSYDVNVTKDGKFTTLLPNRVVKLIELSGVPLKRDKVGPVGFFSSDTIDGIANSVYEAVVGALNTLDATRTLK